MGSFLGRDNVVDAPGAPFKSLDIVALSDRRHRDQRQTAERKPAIFLFYIFGMLAMIGPLQEQRAALHFVVDRQRIYMASTQATTSEFWITDDKMYEKRGARVTISRKDLGVRWVINAQKGTYSETRLTSLAKNETRVEDIHTAGFSYEPEFVWTVADSAEPSTIDGRPCRLTVATGTDDFAEMTLKLWLCHTDRPALNRKANERVLDSAQLAYQNPVIFATELLSKRPDVTLMRLEATVEPPTSSTMAYRVVVRTIENAVPPVGIFDLPSGIQKTP